MKNSLPPCHARRNQGVTLVLVLCFVVLITGLVVAYFSRVLTTRQLSNASSSTTQAEMLANSAADVIVGDLKDEIANGSVPFTPPPAALPAGNTVYVPKQAAYAVPQRNVDPLAAPAIGPIPNLVRRSAALDSSGSGKDNVVSPGIASRASAANSSTASLNGRVVTPARWNRHYLIPVSPSASPPPDVNASDPVTDFTPPDWVFVTAEKGPEVLTDPFKDASGAVTVTGRYAYAIYDEGGLLDINHTGYPSASTTSHIGAKLTPSYADLTQLPAPSPSPSKLLTAANVDYLLGWRHYATLQPTGTFPTLQPSAALADTAYYNLFTSNPASILQVPLTIFGNNKTDQMFLSRQQLIGYFASAGLDPRYLQYLSTFTRSLNQPSYVPETNRPKVLPTTQGGNNAGDSSTDPSTNLTPNFLTARVINAFAPGKGRYDGTPAVIGEPLVKKRFPLNRLAWLTYKGPSFNRLLTDADMKALLDAGITADFLAQGKDANIATYFGLQWDSTNKCWIYIHGSNGSNGAILNISDPSKPTTDVVRLNPGREPDFFELLKASINPGSLAKSALDTGVLTDDPAKTYSAQNQYKMDTSLDAAIMQIGVNIIDQFDTDSFPAQIKYDLVGAGTYQSVYGDENLPYISRIRNGLIRLVEASPGECTTLTDNQTPITNTGVAALMNYPEIWNPHDWSANADKSTQSLGAVYPRRFKVYATTNPNNGVAQGTSVCAWDTNASFSCDADPKKSPGFAVPYQFQFGSPGSSKGGELRTLSEPNTVMTFTVDPGAVGGGLLFREPTMLFRPNLPTNSLLSSPALVSGNSTLGYLAANPGFFSTSGGLLSAVGATSVGNGIPLNPITYPDTGYIGFYMGAHPLRWWSTYSSQNIGATQTTFGPVNNVTYTLACEDGSSGWITYDNKSVTTTGAPNGRLNSGVDAGFGFNGITSTGPSFLDYGVRYYETVDPRSTRFGMLDPWVQNPANAIPPRGTFSFVDQAQGVLKSGREGVNSGTAFFFDLLSGYGASTYFLSTMGWYHDSDFQHHDTLRTGMLSQNNPLVNTDGYFAAIDPRQPANSNPGGTYSPFYYADADGVVRRASGGNVPVPAAFLPPPNGRLAPGLPMAYALATLSTGYSSGTNARQIDSRPVVLNRPFRSVAELGYVYSGTPWKNLDFFLPESGDVGMLDVFCVNDNSDSRGVAAGQVNLNTRQVPVLQAILAGANKNLWIDTAVGAGTDATITLVGVQAQQIASLLVNRTVTGLTTGPTVGLDGKPVPQPLRNVSDLVGRWVKQVDLPIPSNSNATISTGAGINGPTSCDGFAGDISTFLAAKDTDPYKRAPIQRYGESAIRALSNAGQTRVWNLLIDIVAQTGRFPPQAANMAHPLDKFSVEGEQHYWVHVAVDRYTGQVIDKQVEVVKE